MSMFRNKIYLIIKCFKQRNTSLCNSKGFSLIEILVAVSLSSIMLVMIYSTYKAVVKSITQSTGVSEFYENINLAVSKIDRDITNLYYTKNNKNIAFIGDVKGTASVLNFVTINHQKLNIAGNLKRSNPVSDIKEVGYFLKDDPKATSVFLLMRREQAHYDKEPEEGGEENILLENLTSLKFEYKKNNDWSERWDSRNTKKLPQAIRTTITLKKYNTDSEVKIVFISRINVSGK